MAEQEEPAFMPWFRWVFVPAIIPSYFVVAREHHTVLSLVLVAVMVTAAVYRTLWRRRRGLPPANYNDVG